MLIACSNAGYFFVNILYMKNLTAKKLATCYLASGWFNDAEEAARQDILKALSETGISYFSPKDEIEIKPNATQEEQKEAFEADTEFIKQCDFIVASTVGKDMGTLMELGMAYAWGVPSIVYFPNDKNLPVNIMLAQSAYAVATSFNELKSILNDLIKNNFDFSQRIVHKGAVE